MVLPRSRRADAARRVALRKSHSAFREAVNVWRLVERFGVVRADVHETHVVGEYEYDVRSTRISAEYAGSMSDIESNCTAQTMISVAILCSKWPSKSWGRVLPVSGERRNINTSERKRRRAAGRELQAAISALAAAGSTFG